MTDIYGDEIENEEENDDFDEETTTTTTRRNNKDLADVKVENAGDIPLFADADKRGLRTAAYLKVVKLSAPDNGYKGQMPLSTTLETIGQIYGDGRYKIELCNHKHNVLRSIEETIAIGEKSNNSDGSNGHTYDARDQHIAALVRQRERENERIEKLTMKTADQSVQQSKDYTQMVTQQIESSAERERQHMKGVSENQQNFFANMMLQQNQMFQQTIAMMTAGHQQSMELMRAASERERDMSNPMVFISLLMEGLKMGRDLAGEDDKPDWIKGLDSGGDMLSKLLELKKESIPGVPESKRLPPTKDNSKNTENKSKAFTPEEAKAAFELKEALRSRGIDFTHMVSEASKHYKSIPDSELFIDDKDESEDKSDTESEEKEKPKS